MPKMPTNQECMKMPPEKRDYWLRRIGEYEVQKPKVNTVTRQLKRQAARAAAKGQI